MPRTLGVTTRLLHIHSGNLAGGVETLLTTLAGWPDLLDQRFALCFEGRLSDELHAAGTTPDWLGEVHTRRPRSIIGARRKLSQFLHQHHFDAAVCHLAWAQAIFGATVRAGGVPLIFWMHDAVTGRHWLERWARLSPPDLILCNSRYTAATAPRLYPGVPSEVLYYPVAPLHGELDERDRASLRSEFATLSTALVILQASRLEAWKGHLVLLEALGRIAHLPGWVCWIAGGAQREQERAYLSSLKRRIVELGLTDRVRFCGQRNDIPCLMRAAEIYCQPNAGPEPFGISFVEAMQAGLPVVTADSGGASEIVDTTCGIVTPPNDAGAVAEALRTLLEDAGRRARLGAAGRERAAQLCDPRTQIARLATIVDGLSHGSADSPQEALSK